MTRYDPSKERRLREGTISESKHRLRLGLLDSDRSRVRFRCGELVDLVRLPGCCSFCLTLSSFKRIVALVRAGKNERIRKRIDGDGDVFLRLLLLLPLGRFFLSRVRMGNRVVILLVRVRGDVWEILLLAPLLHGRVRPEHDACSFNFFGSLGGR